MEIYWCVYSINRKFERKWLHRNAGEKKKQVREEGVMSSPKWLHCLCTETDYFFYMHACTIAPFLPFFLPLPTLFLNFFLPFPVFLSLVPLLFCFHSLFLICFCFFPFTPLHMWLLCFVSVFNHFFPKHTHTHLCLILLCIITYFFCPFCFDVAV